MARRSIPAVLLTLALGACAGSVVGGGGGDETPERPGSAPAGANPNGSAPPTSGAKPTDNKACSPAPTRIWKLTPDQYSRTAAATLRSPGARPGDELVPTLAAKKVGFSNEAAGLDMSEPHVAQLLQTGRSLAAQLITAASKTMACLAAPDAACAKSFVETYAARAFRRDLAAAEVATYVDYFTKQSAAHGSAVALRLTATAIFMSPSFLFRTELGAEGAAPAGKTVVLTSFEKAQALSYFLTDGPPDDALIAAARAGRLETRDQLVEQARRLAATAAAAPGLLKFLEEHYDTHLVATQRKDAKVFPDWKAETPGDMVKEADAFVADVLWKNDGKLSTLMTAGYTMVNGRLAALYGITGMANTTFDKLVVPNRAGLLTLPAVMAGIARENDTDPVARGKFVRTVLLCQTLPAPPPEVNAVPVPPDGKRTQRERLEQHSRDASCAGCHSLIDKLGLAFETYDGIGRYRTTDVGKTIDASGTLTGARPDGAAFKTAVELASLLARSPDVAQCFVTRLFEYANGRSKVESDGCAIEALGQRFDASGGQLIDLAVGVASDDGFVTRRLP